MRRRRKRKNQFPILIVLFVVSLFCFSVGYSLLREKLSITGKGSIVIEQTDDDEYFKDTVIIDSWGGNGAYIKQYRFTLENIKDVQYVSWNGKATIGVNDKITGCWNAKCSVENGVLTILNEGYNANVSPGGTVDFGLIIEHEESTTNLDGIKFYGVIEGQSQNEVANISLLEEEPIDSTISITYSKSDTWYENEKYIQTFNFSLKNNREMAITAWEFEINKPTGFGIHAVNEANYIEMANVLRFSNTSYNGTVKPGESVNFQIVLSNTENQFPINIISSTGSGA